MTPNDYQALAERTQCPQPPAIDRLAASQQTPLLHAVIGISGEAGELAGAVEGWLWYGKGLDVENVKEELGDLLWYVAEACNALGLSMESVMEANIRKLRTRYPDRYTDSAAANRNLQAEKDALNAEGR